MVEPQKLALAEIYTIIDTLSRDDLLLLKVYVERRLLELQSNETEETDMPSDFE